MKKHLTIALLAGLVFAGPMSTLSAYAADDYFTINQIRTLERAAGNVMVDALGDIEKQLKAAEDQNAKFIVLRHICPEVGNVLVAMAANELPAMSKAQEAFGISSGKANMAAAVNSDRAQGLNSILANGGKVDMSAMTVIERKITLSKGVTWEQLREPVADCLVNEQTRLKIFGEK